MELRHLRTFVAVAEELHFGRAARRLHTAQPAVSRTIQALEEELGAPLLLRSRAGVDLTAAGALLLERARDILQAVEEASSQARRLGEGQEGSLCVGFAGLSALGILPEVLRSFRARHPGVELHLRRLSTREQLEGLIDRRCDVAFTSMPIDDPAIVRVLLRSEPLVALLPAHHPLAEAPHVSMRALLSEPTLLLPRQSEPTLHEMFLQATAGGPEVEVVEVEDLAVMYAMVAAGLGVCHCPASAARLSFGGVVSRPIAPEIQIPLYALCRRQHPSPSGQMLLEHLASFDAQTASPP